MSELESGDASYIEQVTRKPGQSRGLPPPVQLGQAGAQGPAATPTPGSGPSVTLFLPVQDVLLGEGVEAPPFLPDLALPPSSSGLQKGSWLLSRGCRDVAESPVIRGPPLLSMLILGRREMGENTD